MSNRVEKTPEQALEALAEKRERIHRQIVKQRLADNERFQAMTDAYRKTKRYLTEATNLTDADKYEGQKQALQTKLDALEAKRATAEEAVTNLQSEMDIHEDAHKQLATKLIAMLDNGEIPEDFDEQVSALLDTIGADQLGAAPSDPFVDYRRAKKTEEE